MSGRPLGNCATWPLEMPTRSGKGLPIVLKLDNEHEQTEKDLKRYEELLAAEQEKAQSGQFRPYSIRFAHSGDKEFWDTYMSRLDELRKKKEREAEGLNGTQIGQLGL